MRLLLVEDDQVLARTLSKGLRERAFAVDIAPEGEEALYLAAINEYDAVLLDVMLPGLDGFQICSHIRAKNKRTKILMLTARDRLADRVHGLEIGADDYLTKPFDFDELLARLRAVLRRRGDVGPVVLNIADLAVDTWAQTVSRGGRPISLTTKEYTLLEFLALHPGRVIGRAEISAHVWDDNYDPASNLIEVYISRLRGKIDSAGPPLLHTRRGAGYSLGLLEE